MRNCRSCIFAYSWWYICLHVTVCLQRSAARIGSAALCLAKPFFILSITFSCFHSYPCLNCHRDAFHLAARFAHMLTLACSHLLTFTHSLTLAQSLAISRTHSRTHSLTHSLPHTAPLTHSLTRSLGITMYNSFTYSHSLSLTRTLFLRVSHCLAPALTPSRPSLTHLLFIHPLTHSLTHSLAHSVSLTDAITHSHSLTHLHSHSYSHSHSFSLTHSHKQFLPQASAIFHTKPTSHSLYSHRANPHETCSGDPFQLKGITPSHSLSLAHTHSLTHSLTHSFTHTHSLIHSLTHSPHLLHQLQSHAGPH